MRDDRAPVVVTGAVGFIGFHVARRLLADGLAVVGVDNLSPYYDVGLKQARLNMLMAAPGFEFARLDLAERGAVEQAFVHWKPRRVVHLAAQPGVRHSIAHPEDYISPNLVAFFNVLEACRRLRVEHLVYASSSSVYGANTSLPFSADRPADHPLNLYAATKRAGELMAHSYSHLYHLPATGLRFFTVYGPWGRPDMAPHLFTRAILSGEPIKLFNRGDMRRDFTYIDDIVDGVVAILDRIPEGDPQWSGTSTPLASSRAPWRLYNIGANRPEEMLQVIAVLERLTGRKAELELLPMQPGEVRDTYADIEPLAAAVGFRPRVTIEEGMKRFVDWYQRLLPAPDGAIVA